MSPDAATPAKSLIPRLLRLSWRYRAGCIRVILIQLALLTLGLTGLGVTGLGIDYIRSVVQPGSPSPRWPFGWAPPADWTVLNVLFLIGSGVFLLAAFRSVLNYAFAISSARLIEGQVVAGLRTLVYDRLQQLSFRFFDAHASGTLINRVTGDTRAIANFINGVLIQAFIMVLSLAFYLAYMVSIHPPLTLACLATTPLIWILSSLFSKRVQPGYRRNRELVDALILKAAEVIQGISVIKGFAQEDAERERFGAANREVRRQQQKIFWIVSVFTPSISFMTQINLTILLLYGGTLVIRGDLPLGTGFIVFAGLLQQFSGQVSNLAGIANTAQQSLVGAARVFEIVDTPVEITSPPSGALKLDGVPVRGAIEFHRVSFHYLPGEPVLNDISFVAEPGQTIGILGEVGSGKSTLLSLVPRFYDPIEGHVRLDGRNLRDYDIESLRRQVGLVFQESFLFSNTVAANIAFGNPDCTPADIERAARLAAAHEFINDMQDGYDTVLQEGGSNLSGGQRQRLAIARALLLNPSILVLDDPTAAVDSHTEQEILRALASAREGRTTLLVSNRIAALQQADRVVVLERGRIAQQGRPAELLNRDGLFRRTALVQFAAFEEAPPA